MPDASTPFLAPPDLFAVSTSAIQADTLLPALAASILAQLAKFSSMEMVTFLITRT
ncbi:MAG: hypothetical protein ABUS57_21785 [Pseudomonadota bacterium]